MFNDKLSDFKDKQANTMSGFKEKHAAKMSEWRERHRNKVERMRTRQAERFDPAEMTRSSEEIAEIPPREDASSRPTMAASIPVQRHTNHKMHIPIT